jgi:hypothetical protein
MLAMIPASSVFLRTGVYLEWTLAEPVKKHLAFFRSEMLGGRTNSFLEKLIRDYTRPTNVLKYETDQDNYRFLYINAEGIKIHLHKQGEKLKSIIQGSDMK